jgi:lipopolysaccharide transport system ATP-binding protein
VTAAIVVQGVGKAFKRYPSQWARAREWLLRIPSHELLWVLREVSFEVPAGAALGILGANGAGKSTLLKIIARATAATEGSVSRSGRVAALLELGMGFHPEFTGRQNVMMAGQLIGLSLAEVEDAFGDIERFADIGDFMDQPLRTFSSGMQMRLAFGVAPAVRPDVLIVDEALSVGDAAFQRKCYQRIEAFRAEGTALLFVSHDIEAVKRLCDQAIFLADGVVASAGPVRSVCDDYEKALFGGQPRKTVSETPPKALSRAMFDDALVSASEQVYGAGGAVIESCWLASESGERLNVVIAGDPIRWCFTVRFDAPVVSPVFSMMLKTRDGEAVFGTDSSRVGGAPEAAVAGQTYVAEFLIDTYLAPDQYFLNCGVRRDTVDDSVFLSRRIDAAILKVSSSEQSSSLVGAADLRARLSVTPQTSDSRQASESG